MLSTRRGRSSDDEIHGQTRESELLDVELTATVQQPNSPWHATFVLAVVVLAEPVRAQAVLGQAMSAEAPLTLPVLVSATTAAALVRAPPWATATGVEAGPPTPLFRATLAVMVTIVVVTAAVSVLVSAGGVTSAVFAEPRPALSKTTTVATIATASPGPRARS